MSRGRRPARFLQGFVSGALLFLLASRRAPEILIWYLVIPLVFLFGAKFVFLSPPGIDVGLYPPDEALAATLEDAGFKVSLYSNYEVMVKDLENGRIVAALDASRDPPRSLYALEEYRGVALLVAASVSGGLQALSSAAEAAGIAERVGSQGFFAVPDRALAVYTVYLVGTIALYTGLYGGMVEIISMKQRGSLRVVASRPHGAYSLLGFLAGMNTAAIAFTAATLTVAALLLGADFKGLNPEAIPVSAILVLAGLTVVFFASMPLGLMINRVETASALAGTLGFALIFATGLAIPRDLLPEWLRTMAGMSPLTIAVEASVAALFGSINVLEAIEMAGPPLAISLLISGAIGVTSYRRLVSRALEE